MNRTGQAVRGLTKVAFDPALMRHVSGSSSNRSPSIFNPLRVPSVSLIFWPNGRRTQSPRPFRGAFARRENNNVMTFFHVFQHPIQQHTNTRKVNYSHKMPKSNFHLAFLPIVSAFDIFQTEFKINYCWRRIKKEE